jgi:hypothetical protein
MIITFEMDADIIVYAHEKILPFARENQYLFVANCAWWIAGITGLDSGLTIVMDNLETRKRIGQYRISTTPRDIVRSESVNSGQIKLEESLTRNANNNPPSIVSRVTRSNSDHQNLTYFKTAVSFNRRHARWAEELQTYNFDLFYRKGSSNQKADTLSRCPAFTSREGGPTAAGEQTLLRKEQWMEI